MKFGVLGTGMVGEAIAGKLLELGHEVLMGSRSPTNEKATAWAKKAGGKAQSGDFAAAAAFAEIIFNCTKGSAALDALHLAGAQNLSGKILIDVSNPLDFHPNMPPTLFVSNTDSLGERIQRTYPEAKVVKSLNTVNCQIMVNPQKLKGDHDVFVSGNDTTAKIRVIELLKSFGWKDPIDLGDITSARGTEMLMPFWLRLMGTFKTADFNYKIVR